MNIFQRIIKLINPSYRASSFIDKAEEVCNIGIRYPNQMRANIQPEEYPKDYPIEYQFRSYDGYEREKAVRKYGPKLANKDLMLLIERLNDWVPQVRMAALEILTEKMKSWSVDDAYQMLPAIVKLGRRKRHDAHELFDITLLKLADEGSPGLWLKVLQNKDCKEASRKFYKVLWDKGALSRDVLISLAQESGYPILRCYAAQMAEPRTTNANTVLEAFSVDKDPSVRGAVLRLAEQMQDEGAEYVVSSLLDRNAGVRHYAQYVAHKKLAMDLKAYYTEQLETSKAPKKIGIALKGCVEVGVELPHDILQAHLRLKKTNVIRAIFSAPNTPEEWAIEHLLEKAFGNNKTYPAAVNHIADNGGISLSGQVTQLFEQVPTEAAKHAVLMLLLKLSRWERLITLLRLAPLIKQRSMARYAGYFRGWCRDISNGLEPSKNQLSQILELLEKLKKEKSAIVPFESIAASIAYWREKLEL